MLLDLLKEQENGNKNILIKRRIISYYAHNKTSTIPNLARELKLSVPTVTKALLEMCTEGYILNYGKVETTEGRPPTLYGLNPDIAYFIGVDVHLFELNIGIMDLSGELKQLSMNLPFHLENSDMAQDKVCQYIAHFIQNSHLSKEKILNVGINIPGRVNPISGYSYSWFNQTDIPLTKWFTDQLKVPVTIDNDTRAMIYGEQLNGCARGYENVIFINLSWGLGAGFILNGEVYTGRSGFSGELGHCNVFDNEILCHCGKKGCLETEVSGMALHRMVLESLKNGKASILQQKFESGQELTLADIIEAICAEDPLCLELLEEIAVKLGRYLSALLNLLNPELVVIGGTLAAAGEFLLAPLRNSARKNTLSLIYHDSEIVLSDLKERSGVIGACTLARRKIFDRFMD